MSAQLAIAQPRRIKATHRRRRKVAAGLFVQRYYDPGIGRFLSIDAVEARESGDNFNRYAYANNNPYRFTDPDGREAGGGYATGLYTMAPVDTATMSAGIGLVADFTPVIGDIKGIVEAYQNPTLANVSAAVVGLVPIVGDGAGKVIKNADAIGGAVKSLKGQAADLVAKNGGKNRVEMRSPSVKVQTDLAGKSHAGVDTPHTKVSPLNPKAPNQPAYNTKSSEVKPSTQQDIRNARNYLERKDP